MVTNNRRALAYLSPSQNEPPNMELIGQTKSCWFCLKIPASWSKLCAILATSNPHGRFIDVRGPHRLLCFYYVSSTKRCQREIIQTRLEIIRSLLTTNQTRIAIFPMPASSDSPDDEPSFIISSLCWYRRHFGLQCRFGGSRGFRHGRRFVDDLWWRSFSLARWWFSRGCLYKFHNVFVVVVIINANHIVVFLQIVEIIERTFAYHCRIKVVRVNKIGSRFTKSQLGFLTLDWCFLRSKDQEARTRVPGKKPNSFQLGVEYYVQTVPYHHHTNQDIS